MATLEHLGMSREADFYLCGPTAFLRDFTAGLASWGVASDRIHTEIFGPGESETVGIVQAPVRSPHAPPGAPGIGPRVSFARSGLNVLGTRPSIASLNSPRLATYQFDGAAAAEFVTHARRLLLPAPSTTTLFRSNRLLW
ncbi:MAG: domain containing protein [Chthoniobacteraceae bacterium]|nr:domain containing protein [Chthoniobacteraceae bacterium]